MEDHPAEDFNFPIADRSIPAMFNGFTFSSLFPVCARSLSKASADLFSVVEDHVVSLPQGLFDVQSSRYMIG